MAQSLVLCGSAQGVSILADAAYDEAGALDILIVPDGQGTRRLVDDDVFVTCFSDIAAQIEIVTSVCTGSALLGFAGLLEGRTATSNVRAFDWVCAQAPTINWRRHVRWVEDGNRWTSAGVATDIDMTLALVARLRGPAVATEVAAAIEYPWQPTEVRGSAPAILTIFRSRFRHDSGSYEVVANELDRLARAQDGFQDFKTFRAEGGGRCSIVIFAD
jgi:transcriptional regulator GlxA family with amidase domain